MWYIDVKDGEDKYRGVYYTAYRPLYCGNGPSTEGTYQDDSGYFTDTVYWFKYEPISWTILNESNGTALILCDMIIDSQQYDYDNESGYNNYSESTIRKWLNETFYNTAFDDLQKEIILTTTVDNSGLSTGNANNQFACEDTKDKVFLLSNEEVTTYLTSTAKNATDYSKSQGAWLYGSYRWWLRSPYGDIPDSRLVYCVEDSYVYELCYFTSYGVVPVLKIQL